MRTLGESARPDWIERSVPWHYRLGDLHLFTVRLPLLVRAGHFTEFTANPGLADAPLDLITDEVEGLHIRSCPVTKREPRLRVEGRILHYRPAHYHRNWLDLGGTFDDYIKKLDGKRRWNITHNVKLFHPPPETGTGWREYKDPEEMEEYYRLARAVSERTYQERLLDSGMPAGDAFRAQLDELARSGRFRGYILSLKGRVIILRLTLFY